MERERETVSLPVTGRACTRLHRHWRLEINCRGEIGCGDVIGAAAAEVLVVVAMSQEALAIFSQNSANSPTC